MNPFKRQLKRGAQHIAARFGPHTRRAGDSRLLVLMYHRVLPAHDPRLATEEPGMYVSPETFEIHIKTISQYFDFIKFSDWPELAKRHRQTALNACAVTFDDGWADNYEFAYPILRRHGVPATIFLVSDMIGTREIFWPERLARLIQHIGPAADDSVTDSEHNRWLRTLLDAHPLTADAMSECISRIINQAKAMPDDELLAKISASENAMGISADNGPAALLDWTQVEDMVSSGLIDIGSHTRRHARLDKIDDEERLRDEIVTSKSVIEQHTGKAVTSFCFPNGDYTPRALDLVRQHYACAVTTHSHWNTSHDDLHLLGRIGLHEDASGDRTAFLARISGWM